MIDCPHCGKKHRSDEQLDRCKATAERRQARIQKLAAEVERRRTEAAHFPYERQIKRMHVGGKNWDQIAAHLKRNYPSPADCGHPLGGAEWDAFRCAYTWGLTWPVPLDAETKAELLMEKHMTGYFLSLHPSMFLYGYVKELRESNQYDPEVPILMVSELLAAFEDEKEVELDAVP